MIRSFMVALSFRRIYLSDTYDTTITAIFQIILGITRIQTYNNRVCVLFIVHRMAYNKKKYETEVLSWDTIQIWRLHF